ncbi:Tn3 family transposase [Streptomyces sp. CA-251387]|uniref:Tn3 family transposase n=1 Tax=Streptomyces sp. CA-251387 TaxID=3240064 RepID=UPI003D8E362A
MAPPWPAVRLGREAEEPPARYVVTAFTYGSGLGATQAARHMNTVTAHELAAIAKRPWTAKNLARVGADVVDAHLDLDLVRSRGTDRWQLDDTMMDAAVDNLLAETSIRYGGIVHHLVADTYVAPFSRFVPCGVWEAVYLIDSLL